MIPSTLVLNAGSSSLKFAIFGQSKGAPLLLRGSVSSLQTAPKLKIADAQGVSIKKAGLGNGPMKAGDALHLILAEITALDRLDSIRTIGHRIVHGGRDLVAPALLDRPTLEKLWKLVPLAPIHQPRSLEIVAAAAAFLPGVQHFGCFDTAFHASRPKIATRYGLPRVLTESGIVSYGFHGLSYGYIAGKLRERPGDSAGGKVIVAHLGSGASLCAMKDGRSVATTMGFSTLDGLLMSTRCGALDPGVILYLMQERGMSAADISRMLYEEAGLLGISGISGDMQTLLESGDPHAGEAVDLFIYQTVRHIGALAATLEGLDTLVFTAGIGENSPEIRERICAALGWLGIGIDPEANRQGQPDIGRAASAVDVLIIPTDEERAVAEQLATMPASQDRPQPQRR